MVGTVFGINERENTVVLKFGEDTKIEFLKSSVVSRTEKPE
jgi:preprotein translocase subunit YajC